MPRNSRNVPAISRERIEAELAQVLSSDTFSHSTRLSRFLRFVVEQALEGGAGRIKEYVIALEVFDRNQSFDQRTDPIVRVQAGRLRSKLKEYYRKAGGSHDVRIDCVKGTYVPIFRSQPMLAPRRIKEPAIAVMPFLDLTHGNDREHFCEGMTEELVAVLSKVPGLHVAFPRYGFGREQPTQDVRDLGRKLNVGAVLEGSIRKEGGRLRITAQLTNVSDGFLLWSETHDRPANDVFGIQDEVARSIVENLKGKLLRNERI